MLDSTVSLTGSYFGVNVLHAINARQDSTLTVVDTDFEYGDGGIVVFNSDAVIEGSRFIGNTASSGAGLIMVGDGALEVRDSLFQDNVASGSGGAVQVGTVVSLGDVDRVFEGCTFVGNSAGEAGGAIAVHSDRLEVNGSSFHDNSAVDGGAVATIATDDGAGAADVSGCEFSENTASRFGGAIYSDGVGLAIQGGSFDHNSAESDGGAVAVTESYTDGHLQVSGATFSSNTTLARGGAVFSEEARVELNNSAFHSNMSELGGGAVYSTRISGSGRPVLSRFSSFWNNTDAGAAGSDEGGALFVNRAGTGIFSSVFWGNSNDYSGSSFIDVAFTCSAEVLAAGTGNLLLFEDPFVLGPEGQVFLNQDSACVDAGNPAATAGVFTPGLGADWDALSTALTGALDVAPVDMGAHYLP